MWYILYVVLVWVDVFFSCVIHTLSWYKKTDDIGSLADPIWTQNAPILRSSFWDAQQDFCYLSLKLISSHLKKCHPKRQGSCSNYQYSGAALVSRRVRSFFLKLESPFLPWDNIKSWGQCALATCLKHLRHHLHSNSKHILYWKLTYPWLDVGRLRSFWFVRFSGDSLIFVCVCNNLMFMITHIYIYCLIHREGERERVPVMFVSRNLIWQHIYFGNSKQYTGSSNTGPLERSKGPLFLRESHKTKDSLHDLSHCQVCSKFVLWCPPQLWQVKV